MASVFRARHRDDGVEVAVKVLTAKRARDPFFHAAFADEVRAVASLEHPGIIGVYDYGHLDATDLPDHIDGIVEGSPFLVMELASCTLGESNRCLTWAACRGVLLQLLDALAHAHARGVIHRDVKPANVLIFEDGEDFVVKLADFGISHAIGGYEHGSGDFMITGTPQYMAPEQFSGKILQMGPWTDLYALGCLAFELITWSAPFPPASVIMLYNAHANRPRPPLNLGEGLVPDGLQAWIHRLMAPDPEDRFRHAADAAWALLNLPPAARPFGQMHSPERESSHQGSVDLGPTIAAAHASTLDQVDEGPKESAEPEAAGPRKCWRPPMPSTWRPAHKPARVGHLLGAGAGLYGLRPVPMVARIQERDRLWEALHTSVEEGRLGVVVLRGPAGCGKSRLARWLVHRAGELGAAQPAFVYHSQTPGPVEALTEMLRRLFHVPSLKPERLGPHLRARLGDWSITDAALLTKLVAGGTSTAEFQRPDRLRMIARALHDESRRRPVVVWIDDAQWGAEALALVDVLGREATPDASILVVVTVHEEALASRPIEAAELARLQARPCAQVLEIQPLSESEHVELVSTLLGLDHDLTRRIARRTNGNPLFAVELVGDWISQGLLKAGPHGFALGQETLPPLPDDLFHLWNDRVEHVVAGGDGADFEVALEVASLLGHAVLSEEWRLACSHLQGVDFDALMGRLLDLRLATRTQDGFAFGHGMLRETLHRRIRTRGRWRSLHQACALMLGDSYPEGAAGRSERLALHLREAGDLAPAFAYALAAATSRIARSEFSRARELLCDATACLDGMAVPDEAWERDRVDLCHLEILLQRLSFGQARELAEPLLERARRHGRPDIEAHVLNRLARLYRRDNHTARSTAAFQAALEYFEAHGQAVDRACCLEGIAWNAVQSGDIQAGQEHYARVLELVSESDRAATKIVGDTFHGLAEIARRKGDHPGALEWVARGEEFAEANGNLRVLLDFVNTRGEIHREAGEYDRAEHYYLRTLDIIGELGGTGSYLARANLCMVYLCRGEFERARQELSALLAVIEPTASTVSTIEVALATAMAGLGRFHEARKHLDRSLAMLEVGDHVEPDTATLLETLAALATGHHPELAHQAWELARDIWRKLDNPARTIRAHQAIGALRGKAGP